MTSQNKTSQNASLTLTKPLSQLQKPIELDGKKTFVHLSKAALKGVTLNFSGAAESLLDVLADAGLKDKPGELLWVLVYQSLMIAVAELVDNSRDLFKSEPTEGQLGELGEKLEATLHNNGYIVDVDFFARPQDFALFDDFKPELKSWFESLSLNAAAAEVICQRLPNKFTLTLNNQWLENAEDYACIKTVLDSPFTRATHRQRLWLQYNAWLLAQVNERMFHEAFSLSQVYVAPRAYYVEGTVKKQRPTEDIVEYKQRDQESQKIVIDLHRELIVWANHFDKNDAFRVVSGGPGAGKSSLSKMLASELAHSCGYPVLFIPLHQFDLTADLQSAITGFVANYRYLEGNPLDVSNGEDRLLLIFDGLDELSEQGKNGAEMARNFVELVMRDINLHNAQGRKRQVLFTGRDLAVQSCLSSFRDSKQLIHLLPYFISKNDSASYIDPRQLLTIDSRDQWWQKYGVANGKLYTDMPEQLKFEKLDEITSQPLLNYLVALSFEMGMAFSQDTNLNSIYQDLLSSVYRRQYDGDRIHNATAGLDEEKFLRVLEEIALAIWHGDGRTATVEYIQKRCKDSNLTKYLQAFEQSAESGVTRLLTAFYFRQCSETQQGDKTFEFTHKSFGEYLTARRLVRMLTKVAKMLERHLDDPDDGWNDREALEHWAEICGPTTIDEYLVEFIQNEIALYPLETCTNWQQWLCRLIESSLKWGLPMEKLGLSSFAQMQAQARNSDECLLVFLNACALQTKQVSKIDWPTNNAFAQWIKRLHGQTEHLLYSIAVRSLNYLDLSNANFLAQDFYYAQLKYSILTGCNFIDANFNFANLAFADLNSSDFIGTKLLRANLNHSNLSNADLSGAILRCANLTRADLTSADLRQVNLLRAHMEGADLTNAVLRHAELSHADLSNADLTSADLIEAHLIDTNLSNADLTAADLVDADFLQADLTGAIYKNRQLSTEQQEQAKYINPQNHPDKS